VSNEPTLGAATGVFPESGAKIAYVVAMRTDRKGVRTVHVRCSWCDHIHIHGFPVDQTDPGTRVAHCGDARPGRWYRIVGWEPGHRLPRQAAR
jgi:hypothetical protein